MSDLKSQIAAQLHEAQGKYVYLLLAAAASGIALAVQRTAGDALNLGHSVLGLAVLLWGFSFFAGCRNRSYFHTTLYANVGLLSLQDGSHPEAPTHPEALEAACDGVRSAAEQNSTNAVKWGKIQFRLLVAGAVSFLAWHVIEMLANTI
jgi:hypothetical protein